MSVVLLHCYSLSALYLTCAHSLNLYFALTFINATITPFMEASIADHDAEAHSLV
jgi:hypothetical protein